MTLKSGGSWKAEELSDYDASKFTYGTFLPHVDTKAIPVADFFHPPLRHRHTWWVQGGMALGLLSRLPE